MSYNSLKSIGIEIYFSLTELFVKKIPVHLNYFNFNGNQKIEKQDILIVLHLKRRLKLSEQ